VTDAHTHIPLSDGSFISWWDWRDRRVVSTFDGGRRKPRWSVNWANNDLQMKSAGSSSRQMTAVSGRCCGHARWTAVKGDLVAGRPDEWSQPVNIAVTVRGGDTWLVGRSAYAVSGWHQHGRPVTIAIATNALLVTLHRHRRHTPVRCCICPSFFKTLGKWQA